MCTEYNYLVPNKNELDNFFINYGLIYLGFKKILIFDTNNLTYI